MSKKNTQDKELLENPEAIAKKLEGIESWAERNPKQLYVILGVLVLAIGGYLGYRYYLNNRNTLAQEEMFQAQHYFEADSLALALNGDGNNLGFIQIIDEYSGTKAANLAHFYAGASYLKQKQYETAILFLEDFSSDDILIQARAYSLIGDAHMELEQYADAATYYMRAANHEPNKYFSPGYLMRAALAYEKLGDTAKAIAAYDRIINSYWESQEVQNAQKFKMRLQGAS